MTSTNGFNRRTFLTRGAAAGGVVVLGAAGLSACSSSSSSPSTTAGSTGTKPSSGSGTPVRGGSLTVGTIAEIDGFFPATNHWDTNGFLYANTVYDPLMAVAADGTIKGYLAQSMTSNATYDVWTMTLRPGIKFSDGSDLTSAVVKANFTVLADSALAGKALAQVASVATPDDMTLVYTLTGPNPTFPSGLTTQVGYVVGEAMIQKAASNYAGTLVPVGTGPFVYSEWQPNDHFTATRNPNYWRGGLPYLDQITFKPIPDTTQREATLRSGGVDMIESVDPNTITNFEGSGGSGFQLVDTRTGVIGQPTFSFIMLNNLLPPTNDLGIRQALAKGMDQAEVQKVLGGPPAKPATGVFLPDSPYYSATGYPSPDPAGATALIRRYTAQHGPPMVQLSTTPDPRITQLVQVVQEMWSRVGVQSSITIVQQADGIVDLLEGNFQAVPSAQFGAVDPGLNYPWLSTTTVQPIGTVGLNFARNSDPAIESALLTGRSTLDHAARVAAYRTVNERLAVDLPYLWIGRDVFPFASSTRVRGIAHRTLPNGVAGYAYDEGVFFPAVLWLGG